MGSLIRMDDISYFRSLWNDTNTKEFFDNRFNNSIYINEKIDINNKRGLK